MLSHFGIAQYANTVVGIRGGIIIPWSGFRSGINTLTKGFASNGGNLTAEVAYFYTNSFGIGAMIGGTLVPVDEKAFANQYMNSDSRFSSVIIKAEDYYTVSLMPGLFFDLPITYSPVSFSGKILGGLYWVRSPNILYTYEYANAASIEIFQGSEKKANFAIYVGGGIKVKVWEHMGISLDLDYVGSKFNLKYNNLYGEGTNRRHIAYFSLTTGIYYRFLQ